MDDPDTNNLLDENVALPWESIDPEESDPGPLPELLPGSEPQPRP